MSDEVKTVKIPVEQLENRLKLLMEKHHEQTSQFTDGIVSGEYDFIGYLLGNRKPYFVSLPKLDIERD